MTNDNIRRPSLAHRGVVIQGKAVTDKDGLAPVVPTLDTDDDMFAALADLYYFRTHPDVVKSTEKLVEAFFEWVERCVEDASFAFDPLRFDKRVSTSLRDLHQQFADGGEEKWRAFPHRYWNLTYDFEFYIERIKLVEQMIRSLQKEGLLPSA